MSTGDPNVFENSTITLNGGGWIHQPMNFELIPASNITYSYCGELNDEKKGGEKKMADGTRTLYKVYVVDPRKGGKLLDEKTVIAKDEKEALLKAGVGETASKVGLDLDQVDIYAEDVAAFIRPRSGTQKVKVVTSDEED